MLWVLVQCRVTLSLPAVSPAGDARDAQLHSRLSAQALPVLRGPSALSCTFLGMGFTLCPSAPGTGGYSCFPI